MRRNLFLALVMFTSIVFFGVSASPALAQPPRPRPSNPGSQVPDLRPTVKLGSVSLNGGVQKPLASLSGVPIQTPEFTVPRTPVGGTAWVFEIRTVDGRGTISFSNTVPSGVQPSAFQWDQSSGASPGATGRLRYNGCANCAGSVTISVTVRDSLDFSGAAPTGQIKLNLTASGGPPQVTGATRTGNDVIRPTFQLAFAQGTFAQSDGEVVGTYADGLKVRLAISNVSANSLVVVLPRFKASRGVSVALRNPFGSSSRNIELPIQPLENGPAQFDSVQNSTTSGQANIRGRYSVKHTNVTPFDATGTDEITIATIGSGSLACDQQDVLYHSANVRWIRNDGYSGDTNEQGTVSVTGQPSVDHLLRSPDNKVRIAWRLKPLRERHYQVMFGAIDVVGVCTNQIVP